MNAIILDLSPAVIAIMRARFLVHRADKARYISPNPNAAIAAGLAQDSARAGQSTPHIQDAGSPGAETRHYSDSDASARQATDGNMVDAGQTTDPANPAFSLASEEEQAGREAIVAWDLTLRCPDCGSGVEGNARKYHCHQCARRSR